MIVYLCCNKTVMCTITNKQTKDLFIRGICFTSTHKCERNSRKYKEKMEINLKFSNEC